MCGISGRFNFDAHDRIDPALLHRMNAILAHRGPDDNGVFCDASIGLAHTRLSVIDIEGGHQPMWNADNSLGIVYNGEVYNYLELRETLAGRGYVFRTHSDTEVILHAYEEYGTECLAHFNGMFALAVWDTRDRTLFLARDRMGVKPLYY